MTSPECLIMGCRLHIPAEAKSLWGDLHQMGPMFVFNGCRRGRTTNAAWEYGMTPGDAHKELSLAEGSAYFERCGVVLFYKVSTDLNATARQYLLQGSRYAPSR